MKLRNLLIAAAGLTMAMSAAGAASATTVWQHNHPARVEVNHRRANLNYAIERQQREGHISHLQALRLHVRVNRVRREERIFARHHGGHLTHHEQWKLNREETVIRRHL
jgi:hypothetical protein